MLRVRGVRKSYRDVDALRGVDLDAAPGEVVALLGPNGAGKTTLISLVVGLLRPDAGTIEVDGIDTVAHPARARGSAGLAPQELGVYPMLTVRENLELFGRLADLRHPELRRRVDHVAASLQLSEVLDRMAQSLSGGEKRRLQTGSALVHRPPLVLLDEPTAGVDVETRAQILQAVRELAASGTAVCYSTHYLAEVEALAPTVVILDKGEVVLRGPLDELIRRYGQSAVELTFQGPAPSFPRGHVSDDAQTLRVPCAHPAGEVAGILGDLGPDMTRVRGIDLVTPSLESVFLSVTGRRYVGDSEPSEVEALSVVPA